MSLRKVNINIVTWNSRSYISSCLSSIFQQSFRDFSVLVIDNASRDGTVEFIEKNFPEVKILKNIRNLGYARAHNQGIKLSGGKYILIMNPDVILTETYLEKIVKAAEKKPDFSSFTGKILKYRFKGNDLNEIIFTDIIDSVGIGVKRSRNFFNEGENERDGEKFSRSGEIFGVGGELLFIRRSSLEKVKILGEYFDNDFFLYKEDVDLAWRMNIWGLKSYYVAEAVAYHHRRASAPKKNGVKEIIRLRKEKSEIINYYSLRNHLFLYLKNEFLGNFLKDIFYILPRELKKFVYILIMETKNIKAYFSFLKLFSKMLKKRKEILKNKRSAKLLRRWLK